jgi:hypothetical protein
MQRTIAAWGMSWQPAREVSGSDWQAPFRTETLLDSYSIVRFVGCRSLKKLLGFDDFEYDFLAADAERSTSRTRAIDQWKSQTAKISREQAARVLLTPAGQPDVEATQQILDQRDDRPVDILE